MYILDNDTNVLDYMSRSTHKGNEEMKHVFCSSAEAYTHRISEEIEVMDLPAITIGLILDNTNVQGLEMKRMKPILLQRAKRTPFLSERSRS